MLAWGVKAWRSADDSAFLRQVIRRVSFAPDRASLTYQWRPGIPAHISKAMTPQGETERLQAYQQRLAELGRRQSASLAELTQALFRLAAERSLQGGAIAENQAAILALAFCVNGRGLSVLFPEAQNWPQSTIHNVTLNGRDDFAKHFIISAALSAKAGGSLSDAIGLFKEISDSRGGSGFSFNDIAADRAGTRMGELAVADETSARKVQRVMSAAARETLFMPSVQGLPEFMPEAEFKRRFGGVGEPAYNKMMEEIERRVAALAINR
jgi:hypothetical protein